MSSILGAIIVGIARLCLPISFLVAIVLNPLLMLSNIRDWPHLWGDMWDDPV